MLNLPLAFTEKYEHLLGAAKAHLFFAALQEKPRKAFRLNRLKRAVPIAYSLDKKVPVIKNAYYGAIKGTDPEWVSGRVYSQDPAAMFPAYLAPIKAGTRVLDLCAAPGGKTTALGEKMAGKGFLLANEISAKRAKSLRENIERWGLTNVLITNESSAALAARFPSFFDLVLVDAPCSGEGMFRKNPAALKYWSPNYILKCQKRQKEILTQAVKMIQKGGILVYSTCTFAPEEDEDIVAWLVEKHGFKLIQLPPMPFQVDHGHPEWSSSKLAALTASLRFWPQDQLGEGQFLAILKKDEAKTATGLRPKSKKKKRKSKFILTKEEKELVDRVLSQFNLPAALQNWQQTALTHKNHVFIPVLKGNATQHLRIVNNGVELGLLKKKRFEPDHQLAEILDQVKQKRVVALADQSDYFAYLHGESLKVKTKLKGFVLVSYREMIFAFGKISGNGILKNYYPKGLRTVKRAEND